MRTLVRRAGMEKEIAVDSAGILSYHQGELPDPRMRAHAARRGYTLTHRSRPVTTDDFYDFDLIIGMDDRNVDDLRERAPGVEEETKIRRMADYCVHKVVAEHPVSRTCSTSWRTPVPDCWRQSGKERCISINNSRSTNIQNGVPGRFPGISVL